MDVLMLGGTRFFGIRIVELLIQAGHRVTLYTRGNSRPAFWDQVEHILGDRSDHADFHAQLQDRTFDVVVDNFAYSVEDVAAALESPSIRDCRHYIFTSSSVVYLTGSRSMPIRESDVDYQVQGLDPGSFQGGLVTIARTMGEYALEKLKSEQLLFAQRTLPFTIFRPPVVIGPGDHHRRGYFYIQRMLDGGPLLLKNGGAHLVQNVYRDDLARAYMLAIEGEPTGRAFNIAGELAPLQRWLDLAAGALSHEVDFLAVGDETLASGLPDYRESWEFGYDLFLDTRLSESELGFHATPLAEWWPDTVRWYANQTGLPDSAGYENRTREIEFAGAWREAIARLAGQP